jgi:hypothetical protein
LAGDVPLVLDRVRAEDIPDLWPHLEPLFARACEADPSDLTVERIKAEAVSGRRMIWTLTDGDRAAPLLSAFSTVDDGLKVCIGPLAGDEMELWLPLLCDLESHAKEAGFSVSHIEGRPGWQRVLKPYGYRVARVVLEKDL